MAKRNRCNDNEPIISNEFPGKRHKNDTNSLFKKSKEIKYIQSKNCINLCCNFLTILTIIGILHIQRTEAFLITQESSSSPFVSSFPHPIDKRAFIPPSTTSSVVILGVKSSGQDTMAVPVKRGRKSQENSSTAKSNISTTKNNHKSKQTKKSRTILNSTISFNSTVTITPNITFTPGNYMSIPVIDQEGRQWRPPSELGRLRRDGLLPHDVVGGQQEDPNGKSKKNVDIMSSMTILSYEQNHESKTKTDTNKKQRHPFEVTMKRHTMMLRDMESGITESEKKGRFVTDEERWFHKYDSLVRFYDRYGHTNVPFPKKKCEHDLNSNPLEGSMIASRSSYSDKKEDGGDMDYEEFEKMFASYNLDAQEEDDGETYFTRIDDNDDDNNDEFIDPHFRLDLGYWVAQQRYNYKAYNETRMTLQRIEYLNALNFTWDVQEAKWEEQYQALKMFSQKNGHTAVRQNSTLGHWVYKQRWYDKCIQRGDMIDLATVPESALSTSSSGAKSCTSLDDDDNDGDDHFVIDLPGGGKTYKDQRISPLTPRRRALLNEIGFTWNHWDSVWEKSFSELIQYKEEYGHTRVSSTKCPSLAKWVRKHRAEWKRLRQSQKMIEENDNEIQEEDGTSPTERDIQTFLTSHRIQKLNSIDFEWVVRKYTWEDRYKHLLDYKSMYGHVNVPQKYDDPTRHPKLGSWLTTQRLAWRKYHKGEIQCGKQMNVERIKKLDSAGVIMDPALAKFQQRVKDLREYHLLSLSKEKPLLNNKNIQSLKAWVSSTKKQYKQYLVGGKSTLDEERIGLLNDVNFEEIISSFP